MGLAQDRDTSLGMEMLLAQILSSDVKPEKGPGGQLELLKECSICSFCGMLLSFFFSILFIIILSSKGKNLATSLC